MSKPLMCREAFFPQILCENNQIFNTQLEMEKKFEIGRFEENVNSLFPQTNKIYVG